jgi:hypothetical protein
MSEFFQRICELVQANSVRFSEHGYTELMADDILARDVIATVQDGIVVEDYPTYPKGPCVLVLQTDDKNEPIHVLWGIPKGHSTPAVVITAYRPDPTRWAEGFTRRIQ